MTFGEKLFELRSDAGLSQDRLAEMLEVSRQSVSKWERDEAMPDTDKIVLISKIFSVSTDSLLKDEPELKKAAEDYSSEAEFVQMTDNAFLTENDTAQDSAKRFERSSLMDFLDEIFKVIKRHLSLLGLFVIMSQISSVFYSYFNAAYIVNLNEMADGSFGGILYRSLSTGLIGAILGILTGIILVIYGIHLRKNGGADNE